MHYYSSGQAISIRWTISNDGVGVTESNRWHDRVFWSSDELLGTCVYVVQRGFFAFGLQ